MSLLPGKYINKGVATQIQKRQEVVGATNRLFSETDHKSYSFFLTKTPFIRLTSGIDKEGLKDPARQSVLDNGFHERRGDVYSKAPGYEFSNGYGVRPVAGITGMTLNTHNRYGSLRTATVQFEVHNLEQMNLYEEMFMRPGYSALLEWGHSVYLDSDTGVVEEIPKLLSEAFIEGEIVTKILKSGKTDDEIHNESKQAIYQAIEKLREDTSYNYDGMYGLIKNFSWSLRPDGGYSCTVDIVSIGTVIESLAINAGITASEIVEEYNREDTGTEDLEGERGFDEGFFSTSGKDKKDLTDTDIKLVEALERLLPEVNSKVEQYNLKEYEVQLKDSISPNDYRILHKISTEDDPYRVLIRGDKYDTTQQIISKVEDTDVYQWWNGKEIYIETDGKIREYFTLQYRASRFTSLSRQEAGGSNAVGISPGSAAVSAATKSGFWDVEFQLIYNRATQFEQQQVTETTDNFFGDNVSFVRTETVEVEVESVNFILNTSNQFNSRIHLMLYLLKREVIGRVDSSLKGITPTQVYQEIPIEFNSLSVSPTIETDYQTVAIRRMLGEGTSDSFHYYIQLGAFLDILNLFIPTSKEAGEPLFRFYTDREAPHKYKTLEQLHASVDITKCMLPDSYGIQGFTTRGDILGIFIELDYLFGLIEKGLVNGDLKGYDIVTEILRDINVSVGQINELALQFHEEEFLFHVVDRKLVGEEPGDEIVLELIGEKSILRNITMNSKLSPGISTQIAISAQADPTSNGIEGTLFERFNKGLKDRYIPEKRTDIERALAQAGRARKELEQKLALAFNYLRFVYGGTPFTTQQVPLPGVVNEYTLLTKELLQTEGADRSYGGILPFELGLEVEGISGLQVMDSFLINQSILPRSYQGDGNFGFLITGLTHKVDSNGWVTEIKSQIYNRPGIEARNASIGRFSLDSKPKQLFSNKHTPWTGDTPNADKLRETLTKLGYQEKNLKQINPTEYSNYKYGELSSGADIGPLLADRAAKIFTGFKETFPNYTVKITAGNDVWHHDKAPGSRHTNGWAIDFVITSPLSSKVRADMSNYLSREIGKLSDVNFKDEYTPDEQSGHATGNHFHFSVNRWNLS